MLLSAPQPGVPAFCSQAAGEDGGPGAACAAHKGLELDQSHRAQGRCGCGEATFVKTGLFGNATAGVLMENQSVFCWSLCIVREEEGAAGREVFSLDMVIMNV